MFQGQFFPISYFPPAYFPKTGALAAGATAIGGEKRKQLIRMMMAEAYQQSILDGMHIQFRQAQAEKLAAVQLLEQLEWNHQRRISVQAAYSVVLAEV